VLVKGRREPIGGWSRHRTTAPPKAERIDWRRVSVVLTVGILVATVVSIVSVLPEILNQWGEDYGWFIDKTQRFLETGEWYNLHQYAPYEAASGVDVLYPPIALYLFVPFAYVPAFLWWAIPLGILGWHVWTAKPQWWAWPVLALLVFLPRNQSIVIWGSTGMWVAAFAALGLRFAWASPFVLFKPTFAPFALVGLLRRVDPSSNAPADGPQLVRDPFAQRVSDPNVGVGRLVFDDVVVRGDGAELDPLARRGVVEPLGWHGFTLNPAWLRGLVLFCGLSLLLLPMWFDFLTITRNNVGPWPGLLYSVPDYLFMLIPVTAWAARDRG
jgi:hypothetical protein